LRGDHAQTKKIERDDDSKKSHPAPGLEFELRFVATVERARNHSRLCFACRRIFYVTNRLRAIRPIPMAIPHDLVGHGACRGGNVVCQAALQLARAKASAIFLLPKSVESSVAAFAGGLKREVSGADATAICTASSKRSYSSSLIALSFESSGRFARFVRIVIPQHYRRLISGYE
jgi:hypothetical protein